MIRFADWRPDVADVDSGYVRETAGVLPVPGGWAPWKGFNAYSQAAAATPQGGYISWKKDGTRNVWTGTGTKLYKLARTSNPAWTDVSRTVGGNYAIGLNDRWGFEQFGTTLIAVNINDTTQSIDIESGTNFAALAGSPPSAKYIAIVKDFVMLGNISTLPQRVVWSAQNSSTGWTAGTNQSDVNDFPDGGHVTGIVGGEVGLVFQEECIRRLSYVGLPTVFQIDKIEGKRGLRASFSLARIGAAVYFYSPEGFAVITLGGDSSLIGTGVLNEWFLSDAALGAVNQMRGIADPLRNRVYWVYRSNNTPANFDTILCFDASLNRWSMTRFNVLEVLAAVSSGYTLEDLNALGTVDSLAVSLDDPSLRGDVPVLAAFDATKKLGFFSGANQEAVIETADFEPTPGRRSFVKGVRPIIDTTTVNVSVRQKALPSSLPIYSAEAAPDSDTGLAPFRVNTRYAGVRCRIPAGTTWTKATGIDIEARPAGSR